MNIMNKLYKCALGLLTAFILSFTSFSSASYQGGWIGNLNLSAGQDYEVGKGNANIIAMGDNLTFCVFTTNSACNLKIHYNGVNVSTNTSNWQIIACITGVSVSNSAGIPVKNEGGSCNVGRYIFMPSFDIPQYTSLQCQTEYSLIPIEEVTANYCRLNFDLIDPQECPINSGTGAIVRSNLMINDIPYAQNQNINVFIPDFLNWNIAFNDFNTTIEVEGYNADEEYIENVINQEKLTPTNKDIEEMLTGFMTNYFPYLALAIVFLYLARKIFKLFK